MSPVLEISVVVFNKCDFYEEYSKIDVLFEIYDINSGVCAKLFPQFEVFVYES